jgi:hypothetical protein
MIPSKNLEDDIALRSLVEFTGERLNDRRQLALATLVKLFPIQQVINQEPTEFSKTTHKELEMLMSQMLTYIDIVMRNR